MVLPHVGAGNDSAPDSPQFRGSSYIYEQTSRLAPVPAGVVKLVFLLRLTRGTERYLLGFRVGDFPECFALEVTEREIFDFGTFQRLALTTRGVFASSYGARCWAAEIANAAIAGTKIKLDNLPSGFEEILAIVGRVRSAVI